MKLCVLALDFDGTLTLDGTLSREMRSTIEEARQHGVVVVLVTGRILAELRALLGDLQLFDAVVAENGAVIAFPRGERVAHAVAHCPAGLLEALRARGLEARAGECVVELPASACHAALDVVHELELPLALHFNRGRLMILPQAISKATGLRAALRTLRLSPHNAIAVGDAENDHELLAACEIGAAVGWGSAALRAHADTVIEGEGPPAVAAFVRRACESPRIHLPERARRSLVLGHDARGASFALAERGRDILVAGDPQSGKSWVAGLLCEQLVLQGYCLCVIDPEGDYAELERMPGVLRLGGTDAPPSIDELSRALRHADVSVVVDLARLRLCEKRAWVERALRDLAGLRRETGLPHRIVLDEAHEFLREAQQARLLDRELAGHVLVSYRLSSLHPDVVAAADSVLVTRETDAREVELLHRGWSGDGRLEEWRRTLGELAIDEAALLPARGASERDLRRFRVAPRLTPHVRHRRKYAEVALWPEQAFRFVYDDGVQGPQAASLEELARMLGALRGERIRGHLVRRDLSRWIAEVFRDAELAGRIHALEVRHAQGDAAAFAPAAIRAIEERYLAREPLA